MGSARGEHNGPLARPWVVMLGRGRLPARDLHMLLQASSRTPPMGR